jgi:hypothetical protein
MKFFSLLTCRYFQAHPNAQVSWTDGVLLDPICADLELYTVSAAVYKRTKKEHFFSDIYVRTLEVEAEGYSVLTVPLSGRNYYRGLFLNYALRT